MRVLGMCVLVAIAASPAMGVYTVHDFSAYAAGQPWTRLVVPSLQGERTPRPAVWTSSMLEEPTVRCAGHR